MLNNNFEIIYEIILALCTIKTILIKVYLLIILICPVEIQHCLIILSLHCTIMLALFKILIEFIGSFFNYFYIILHRFLHICFAPISKSYTWIIPNESPTTKILLLNLYMLDMQKWLMINRLMKFKYMLVKFDFKCRFSILLHIHHSKL